MVGEDLVSVNLPVRWELFRRFLGALLNKTCPCCQKETMGDPVRTGEDMNDWRYSRWTECRECRTKVRRTVDFYILSENLENEIDPDTALIDALTEVFEKTAHGLAIEDLRKAQEENKALRLRLEGRPH